MTGRHWAVSLGALVLIGLAWGLSVPLSKIAVSTGHRQFGLIFWQLVIGTALLAPILARRRTRVPRRRPELRVCLVIALTGTLVPGAAYYVAITHLSAGIMSIVISLVPMMAFPMALALGTERFAARRLAGLLVGLAGTLALILPEAGLPDRGALVWLPVALVAPLCYAVEGNYVARCGTAGLDPVQVLFGASAIGAVLALPLALASGQFISPLRPFGAPEAALVSYAVFGSFAYCGYVWLVGRAGPVFAMQVSYLVTGFGVLAAMIVLGERYPASVWLALALVLTGVFLVQPRPQRTLAQA